MGRQKAIIYGVGKFYKEIGRQIEEQFEVIACVDRKKQDGAICMEEASQMPFDKIVIAIYDIAECFNVIRILMDGYNIPASKITLGRGLSEDVWDSVSMDSRGNIRICKNGLRITSRNVDEYNNIYEIYKSNFYGYYIGENKDEIVLDIGMNIGGAALYFFTKKEVKKIYGYEPFKDTYLHALENMKDNGCLEDGRLECFRLGVSDTNEERDITYNKNMSCGQSSDMEVNRYARGNYQDWEMISSDDDETERIQVVDIKDIVEKIYQTYEEENIILKMNCEGEEYKILDRLDECNLFCRIKVIMLEWHYKGEESIARILKKHGYIFWHFYRGNNLGLIYAYKK